MSKIIQDIIDNVNNYVWGIPMIILLFGTHIFMTIRLKFIQKYTFKGISLSLKPDDSKDGEVSPFGALATALAATIGTGNIIGVSTAVSLGGAGAVFWTWITGIFGMATKYSETLLSMSFRSKNEKGEIVGGPMYVLEKALNLKFLGIAFAVFTVLATLGTGCAVQSKAISAVIYDQYGVPRWFVGIVIMIFAAFVILGGVKKIAKVCEKLVPFMAIFYILGCIMILLINYQYLIDAIVYIFKNAFSLKSVGGGLAGRIVIIAARYGIARGLFSNESGLGTAPMIASSAKSKNSCRQSLISMTGTFYDTAIVCAMTGLVIVSSMLHYPARFTNLAPDQLTSVSFATLPFVGGIIVSISLTIFAFTTILGWACYGERCIEYLFGIRNIKIYRLIFLAVIVIGSTTELSVIWGFADIMNGLMVIPNVISIILLNNFIVDKTKYFVFENRLDEQEQL